MKNIAVNIYTISKFVINQSFVTFHASIFKAYVLSAIDIKIFMYWDKNYIEEQLWSIVLVINNLKNIYKKK